MISRKTLNFDLFFKGRPKFSLGYYIFTLKVHNMSEDEKKLQEEVEKTEAEEVKEEAKPEAEEKQKKSKKAKKKPKTDELAEGDFVLVEMTGRVEDTSEVFDTTDEELAKEEGIYNENQVYGPKLVVIGQNFILKGLDLKLPGLKVGEEAKVEIPPEDAFGVRRQEQVQTVPFRLLRSKGVNPIVGARLEVDGRMATIRSVGGGRVQLDYNHPQAGKSVVYDVKPIERYEDKDAKLRALVGRFFLGIDLDLFKIKATKKKVKIDMPEQVFFGENIQMAKRGVAMDIQRFFEDVTDIEFIETIKRPKTE